MAGAALEPANDAEPTVRYNFTIEQLTEKFRGYERHHFDTPEAYDHGKTALGELSKVRNLIEARRKALKAGALEYGRKVDSVAKELFAVIARVEEPLKLKKKDVDEAEQRAAEAAAEAARLAEEERVRIEREVEETARRLEHEAQQKRINEERAALAEQRREQDAELAKVRAELDAARAKADADAKLQQAEMQRQRDEIAAERRKAEAERAELDRIAAAKKAEEEAAAAAERERVAAAARAEEQRIEAERLAADRAAKAEAMRPDAQKLMVFADMVRAIGQPVCVSASATHAVTAAMNKLAAIAEELETFAARAVAP